MLHYASLCFICRCLYPIYKLLEEFEKPHFYGFPYLCSNIFLPAKCVDRLNTVPVEAYVVASTVMSAITRILDTLPSLTS